MIRIVKRKNLTPFLLLIGIIMLGAFLRLYGLGWDQEHFLHPDERLYINALNISLPTSLQSLFSINSPLNPHMFYYGSFPLYLYKIVSLIFQNTNALFLSRYVSSFFSIITIPLIYLIGKRIWNHKTGIIASFIFAFAPGSIQYAHFNTTESFLIFFLSLICYLSIKLFDKPSLMIATLIGIVCGLAVATKIIALTFFIFPLIALFPFLLKRQLKPLFLYSFSILIPFLLFAFLGAPYQLIDWPQFYKEQSYMQGVILGKTKPPFTIIYEGTFPYIFPLINILPFTAGFISLPLSLIGFFLIIKKIILNRHKNLILLFITIFPLLYFIWSGSWYVKFERYYLLLLPFISLWAGYGLSRLNKKVMFLFLILISLNGILYLRVYLQLNTRIAASYWIYRNIPSNSILAGEHWDDNLPLPLENNSYSSYNLTQLTVYDPDNKIKIEKLANTIATANYIILSSRRVYYSILQNKQLYPYTSNFYSLLFSEKLGYKLKIKFTNYPFLFSDDIADESFQSYDHPPVLIFENVKKYSEENLFRLLTNGK